MDDDEAQDVAETQVADGALETGDDREQRLLVRLREALLAAEPALDRSMVTGDSLEELEASFAAARMMLAQMREAVRREQAAAIPAGAAQRTNVTPVSAFSKIRDGLAVGR
jgi:hypothetical protein